MDLRPALQVLSDTGYRPAAAPALLAGMGDAARALAGLVAPPERNRGVDHAGAVLPVEGTPVTAGAGGTAAAPAAHLRDQLVEIHRLVGGSNWPQLAFVRRHALACAEHRLPLTDVLRVCREAAPHIERWLLAAAPPGGPGGETVTSAVSTFVAAWVEAVTGILVADYVAGARQLAAAEADRRARRFELLLDGGAAGAPDAVAPVAGAAADAGAAGARHCVVALRPADAGEMRDPARADRLLAATRAALDQAAVDALYGMRDQRVVVIASAGPDPAAEDGTAAALPERVGWPLMRVAQGIVAGVSAETGELGRIPEALREAEVALELAGPGQRVVQYRDIPLRRLVVHLARRDVRPALPRWTHDFLAADRRARGTLSSTLRGYAAADMNVLRTAKDLAVHPNTVYGRIRKVREVTGLDATHFESLGDLLLALDCLDGDAGVTA